MPQLIFFGSHAVSLDSRVGILMRPVTTSSWRGPFWQVHSVVQSGGSVARACAK